MSTQPANPDAAHLDASAPVVLGLSTTSSESVQPSDGSRWFAEEVQPHEPQLRSFLRGSFPTVRDVDDVVQESYLRIWKTRAAQPVRSARAFLFRVAQHVAVDFIRKAKHSPIDAVADLRELPVVEEGRDAVGVAALHEKSLLLAQALVTLPPRSRKIIMLCKFQGKLRREVAAELGISERTVDVHLYRGIQRIEAFLRQRGVHGVEP